MLADAGKTSKTVDKEVVETIEVKEEYEFVDTTLAEFVELEAKGLLETEESAAGSIVERDALVKLCDKHEPHLMISIQA